MMVYLLFFWGFLLTPHKGVLTLVPMLRGGYIPFDRISSLTINNKVFCKGLMYSIARGY